MLIRSPFSKVAITGLFETCRKKLFVSSPFVSQYGIEALLRSVADKNLTIQFLTSITTSNLTNGSLDIVALTLLLSELQHVSIYSLPQLHAKVYIADRKVALITSANLTRGGLVNNYEYGIRIDDRTQVKQVRKDMNAYAKLGSNFSIDILHSLSEKVKFLSQQKIELSTEFSELTKEIETDLLVNRVRGKTITEIFSDTIIYLLKNQGNMTTDKIYEQVQNLHSDICDDKIDRIINSQSFGRLWKHQVRNAQVSLKRRHLIDRNDFGDWHLT